VAKVLRVSSGGSTALSVIQTQSALEKMTSPVNNIGKDVGHLRELLKEIPGSDMILAEVAGKAIDAVKAFACLQEGAIRK